VAEGFEVRRKGEHEIVVDPGVAYDREGRDIVLASPATYDVIPYSERAVFYVVVSHKEYSDKADFRDSGGVQNHTRITEGAEISFPHEPPRDGSVIPLARVHLHEESKHILQVQTEIPLRRRAGAQATSVAGWLRLPFKPVRMDRMRVGNRLVPTPYRDRDVEADFIVDVGSTYCGERGARGSMGVPTPPGAGKITAFRIAGETKGSVQMELYRTGWNLDERKGESTMLIKETVSEASFHRHIDLKEDLQYLNPESHSLALSVVAEGETTIWLVAARFE
jgi:hypothetical protein